MTAIQTGTRLGADPPAGLPFRLPIGAKRLDYSHPNPKNRRLRKAADILYIGRDYKTGQELWISNEDGRQHVAVPGTTGAGKTAALVSLCANTLAWGSGFIFVDGKADNRLYAAARRSRWECATFRVRTCGGLTSF